MAVFRRRQPNAQVSNANALTAAAAQVEAGRESAATIKYDKWQDEAWAMYHDLGEYRQGVTWLANVISRIRLVPAYAPESPGDEPIPIDAMTEDPAVDLVQDIAHGIGGQAELLRSAAVHLTVAGEGWFVGRAQDDDGFDINGVAWRFYAANEIKSENDVFKVRTGEASWKPLPEESLPIRVWRPDDQHHWKADSSTHAALPIMRRLELLNRRVDAQAQSRLAMNGVYWLPSEIVFPPNPAYPEADDPFVAQFMDIGVTAIKTPGSATAAFPIVNRAPGQWIEKIRHDKFFEGADADLRADREFEIRRLATAIDVPPEVLLGMAGLNHWGAWQVEESALKTTVTNLIELICWSLTTGYLTPALQARYENPLDIDPDEHRRIVWYDTSELSVRPDRSQDTIALWRDLAITDDALTRETGLDVNDLLMDSGELKRRIGLKLVTNPLTAEAGLELLGLRTAADVASPGQAPELPTIAPVAPGPDGSQPPPQADSGSPPPAGLPAPTPTPAGVS